MRVRLFAAALAASTFLSVQSAAADPVTLFLGGLLTQMGFTGAGGFLAGLGAFSPGIFAAGYQAAAFLSSGLGSLLVSVGSAALQYALGRPKTSSEASRVNSRVPMSYRFINLGRKLVGGSSVWGEYDAAGNWWFIIYHGDSELMTPIRYWLDGIPVTLDANGRVTTKDFTIDKKEGGQPWVTIKTVTFTPGNPVPDGPQLDDFRAAFPQWTVDHKLVGTCFSVIKCKSFKPEERYKHYTWRGPAGIGEPSVALEALWDRVYDPRNPAHDPDDMATWGTSENAALIWARYRTHAFGRAKRFDSIAWDKVAENADVCDETVLDLNGNPHPRYRCGLTIWDDKERGTGEAEIMLTMDGVYLRDAAGKSYVHAGRYETPTLHFDADRDSVSMASRDAADGEIDKDGVIVNYIDPEFGHVKQPSAPWLHPDYVDHGQMPRYLPFDVEGCYDHNQAMRLAKAAGMRSLARSRLAPVAGVRASAARRERSVSLAYDEGYSGDYEIVTPVERDASGMLFQMGMVKTGPDNWTLLPGEEKPKPAPVAAIEYDADLPYPASVTITSVQVPGSDGQAVRLESGFAAPPRVDYRYEFKYRVKSPQGPWKPFVVLMDDLTAYTDTVSSGEVYQVQYNTVTTGGRSNDPYPAVPLEITAVADTVAPPALTSVTAPSIGLGAATFTFSTANDSHQRKVQVYREATGAGGAAPAHGGPLYAGPNSTYTFVDGDATRVNAVLTPDFAADTNWTKGTDWTISAGKANKAAGTASDLSQAQALTGAQAYRIGYTVSGRTAGSVKLKFTGGTQVNGVIRSADGIFTETMTAASGNTAIAFEADAAFDGKIDDVVVYPQSASSIAAGLYDYELEPQNGSSVPGARSGAYTVRIY